MALPELGVMPLYHNLQTYTCTANSSRKGKRREAGVIGGLPGYPVPGMFITHQPLILRRQTKNTGHRL